MSNPEHLPTTSAGQMNREELENLEPFEGFKEFETPEGLVEVSFTKGQNGEDVMWISECAEVESKNRKL